MRYFPAFLDLQDRDCLVVGAGEMAVQKTRLLLDAGARVDAVAVDSACPAFDALVGAGTIQSVSEARAQESIAHYRLAFIASRDDGANTAWRVRAEDAKVLVNVVDQTEDCGFITPSIVDRGDVVIGISTSGSSPVLARMLREQIERILPARIGQLAAFAKHFRNSVKAKFPFSERRGFWEKVLHGSIGAAVLAGDAERAHQAMLVEVNQAAKEGPNRPGQVFIVGTGPGNPDLLTLRALHVMQQADVVLYDRLIGPEILKYARRDAEQVFVGKERNNHHLSQDEIQHLMLKYAREGRCVVRLKGGDPFVFGRGGEEQDYLSGYGVPVEVVPGVTSALGCAAGAQIPLTHRDHAHAVTLVTAYGKAGADAVDWQGLAQLSQTLVFYMGVSRAELISRNLINAGMAENVPVAIVENGTLETQRVVSGRLGSLGKLVSMYSVKGPAIIIVGEVARYAQETALDNVLTNVDSTSSREGGRQIA